MKVKYETDRCMRCITPCPFFDGMIVGSGACMECASFYGKDKKHKVVNCNRKILDGQTKKRVKLSKKTRI